MLSPIAKRNLKPLGCYSLAIALNILVLIYLARYVRDAPTHRCSRYIKERVVLRLMPKKAKDSIVVTDRPLPLLNQLSSESNDAAGSPSTEGAKCWYDIFSFNGAMKLQNEKKIFGYFTYYESMLSNVSTQISA